MPRTDPDASYILNLCDALLERPSFRHYRFPFLFDKGRTLPVDAFYPDLGVVVEYRGEPSRHDRHKRAALLERGVSLTELYPADFPRDANGRLRHLPEPIRAVLRERLGAFVPAGAPDLLRDRGVDPRPLARF